MVAQIAAVLQARALARPTPVRFSQRLLARCETHTRPQNRKGLVLTRSTGGRRRICLRETLEKCPTPPSTQRRGRRLVALDRQRWDSGPPGHTHGPHLPFPVGFSLRSCPPGSRPQRRQGRGTPCEATATHEPQTPPSLSLRLRTPLAVIHKCILPPFLNNKLPSVSPH